MNNKVEICGINTAELRVFSNDENMRFLKKIKAGDGSARSEFINGNLKLVLSVVRRFAGKGDSPDDLFQVGCIGLMKAIDNFDMSLNLRFSTYAVPMIIGEIRRYLRDNNAIRVSRSMRDTAYRALSVKEELTATLQREPTCEEIAMKMGEKRRNVVIALEAISSPISLFEPAYNDDSDSVFIMDQISDKSDNDSGWIDEMSLKQAIKQLSDRERHILSLRYFKGKTQVEVAKEIEISQAQVSRLEKNALDKIKEMLN